MFKRRKRENLLLKQIDNLNKSLLESNLIEITQLLGNRKKLLLINLIAGISRGIGIGIGVTIITSLLIMLLQKIVTLNIPIIGEYIADIVEIVQKSRWKTRILLLFFIQLYNKFEKIVGGDN